MFMNLQAKIRSATRTLANPGPMLPGTISDQYSVCGKPGCKCMAPEKPQRHGPYAKLSFGVGGKHSTVFIKQKDRAAVEAMTENYKGVWAAVSDLALLSVELLRQQGVEAVAAVSLGVTDQTAPVPLVAGGTAPSTVNRRMAQSKANWKAKAIEKTAGLERQRIARRDLTASRGKWRKEALASRRSQRQCRNELALVKHELAGAKKKPRARKRPKQKPRNPAVTPT